MSAFRNAGTRRAGATSRTNPERNNGHAIEPELAFFIFFSRYFPSSKKCAQQTRHFDRTLDVAGSQDGIMAGVECKTEMS